MDVGGFGDKAFILGGFLFSAEVFSGLTFLVVILALISTYFGGQNAEK